MKENTQENKSANEVKEEVATIPFYAYDMEQARTERREKRLIIALVIAVALIFISNMAWLFAWCQYDYVDTSVSLDSGEGGFANFIGNDGDINNGKDYGKDTVADESTQGQQGN
ncbi:MAG: hypothetical protein NC253_05360 [Ruminococcus sp.]|nr:hypothetical protein [Ruminococcus sp.]MCM1381799.1 hypothetical protein [Muribaculaceae bacterium]MCM1478257.1 hypothetical protein [Muribaculaceae bacterium]